jgi:hypothetical protein
MRAIVVALLFLNVSSFAQKKKKDEEPLLRETAEWFEGSILLNDGTELKGLVKYNDKNGVLAYQDGTDSKVFTSSRVSGFEFFDESLQNQRVFYSFPYEDSQTGVERPLFFELVRDYRTFAVLSRLDQLDLDRENYSSPQPTGFGGLGYTSSTRLVVSQTETIFLMNSDGEIKPYLKTVNKEDEKFNLVSGKDLKTTSKMMDEDLLIEFIKEPLYSKLKVFARENDLKFKRKDDFLKILKYYDSLIAE